MPPVRPVPQAAKRPPVRPAKAGWSSCAATTITTSTRGSKGAQYVREQFLKKLETEKVELPVGKNHALELVPIKDLGISYPVLINPSQIVDEPLIDPTVQDNEDEPGAVPKSKSVNVPRFDFVVQFCWQETPPSVRAKKKAERTAAAAAAAAASAADPGAPAAPPGTAPPSGS